MQNWYLCIYISIWDEYLKQKIGMTNIPSIEYENMCRRRVPTRNRNWDTQN